MAMDPMDELVEMDRQEKEAHRQTDSVVGCCDPICELVHNGDPGRGLIDSPESNDGWIEAGANAEESFLAEFDDLVSNSLGDIFR